MKIKVIIAVLALFLTGCASLRDGLAHSSLNPIYDPRNECYRATVADASPRMEDRDVRVGTLDHPIRMAVAVYDGWPYLINWQSPACRGVGSFERSDLQALVDHANSERSPAHQESLAIIAEANARDDQKLQQLKSDLTAACYRYNVDC